MRLGQSTQFPDLLHLWQQLAVGTTLGAAIALGNTGDLAAFRRRSSQFTGHFANCGFLQLGFFKVTGHVKRLFWPEGPRLARFRVGLVSG